MLYLYYRNMKGDYVMFIKTVLIIAVVVFVAYVVYLIKELPHTEDRL